MQMIGVGSKHIRQQLLSAKQTGPGSSEFRPAWSTQVRASTTGINHFNQAGAEQAIHKRFFTSQTEVRMAASKVQDQPHLLTDKVRSFLDRVSNAEMTIDRQLLRLRDSGGDPQAYHTLMADVLRYQRDVELVVQLAGGCTRTFEKLMQSA